MWKVLLPVASCHGDRACVQPVVLVPAHETAHFLCAGTLLRQPAAGARGRSQLQKLNTFNSESTFLLWEFNFFHLGTSPTRTDEDGTKCSPIQNVLNSY